MIQYNEACATCGIPADLHLGPSDPMVSSPHSTWGDRNRCRTFVRCDPPRAAYGLLDSLSVTLTRIEQVAIIDALHALNGQLPLCVWDTARREAAERVLAKLGR